MKINDLILEADPDVMKDRVLRLLAKKSAEDPVFDKTYKLLVGKQIAGRIENYINGKKNGSCRYICDEFNIGGYTYKHWDQSQLIDEMLKAIQPDNGVHHKVASLYFENQPIPNFHGLALLRHQCYQIDRQKQGKD